MNIKNIRSLAQIMQNADLSAIEITEGETKIRLEKDVQVVNAYNSSGTIPISQRSTKQENDISNATTLKSEEVPVDFNMINEVKSPMVGVFYEAPSPGAQPYVKVGDKVKKGDVLCIIEAMKLMNEIVAETDGEIVDICVQNGEVVEFSQILYKIF